MDCSIEVVVDFMFEGDHCMAVVILVDGESWVDEVYDINGDVPVTLDCDTLEQVRLLAVSEYMDERANVDYCASDF